MKEFFKDFWWMFLTIAVGFIIAVVGIVAINLNIKWKQKDKLMEKIADILWKGIE